MNITTYFANSGVPATGLSPIINIRDLSDNSLVITGAAMSEVGDGFYKYTFAVYDTAKDYTIRCDGGVTLLAADRYSIATTGQEGEVSLIKVKTDYLPSATAGAANGLAIIDATGVKLTKTVDLTAGQSIVVSDKTGFSLSATGADLILKSSTFIQAIVAAVNEFATYGLTALNTLLVSTGIKTATTAAPSDMALNSTVAKEATLTTKIPTALSFTGANVNAESKVTAAPTDMALNSTVGKETTLTTIAGYIDTEIGTIITAVGTTIPNAIAALPTDADVNAACDTAISDAALATSTNVTTAVSNIEVYGDAHWAGQGSLTAIAIRQEMDSNSTKLTSILEDTGTTLPAQIAAIPSAAGTGSTSWSYTLTDADTGAPIEAANVWVSIDSPGANIIASGITNSGGIVTFMLNTGLTIYVWRSKPGYDFVNPDQEAT